MTHNIPAFEFKKVSLLLSLHLLFQRLCPLCWACRFVCLSLGLYASFRMFMWVVCFARKPPRVPVLIFDTLTGQFRNHHPTSPDSN